MTLRRAPKIVSLVFDLDSDLVEHICQPQNLSNLRDQIIDFTEAWISNLILLLCLEPPKSFFVLFLCGLGPNWTYFSNPTLSNLRNQFFDFTEACIPNLRLLLHLVHCGNMVLKGTLVFRFKPKPWYIRLVLACI